MDLLNNQKSANEFSTHLFESDNYSCMIAIRHLIPNLLFALGFVSRELRPIEEFLYRHGRILNAVEDRNRGE